MTLMQRMDTRVHRKTKTVEIYLELEDTYGLGDFLRAARAKNIAVLDVERDSEGERSTGIQSYMATLHLPKRRVQTEVTEELSQLDCIAYIYII